MRSIVFILSMIVCWPLGVSWAQSIPENQFGVSMGHLHYHVRDLEANKRFWIALGATPLKLDDLEVLGEMEVMKFPGCLIFLNRAESSGGSEGAVVNHVGFLVPSVAKTLEKMKAAGYKINPRVTGIGTPEGDVFTPEGERIEVMEDMSGNVIFIPDGGREGVDTDRYNRKLTVPIALQHIHFYLPESSVMEMKAWYVRMFGALPGKRYTFEAANLPGVNLNFSGRATTVLSPTKGRMLDHVSFEIKNLQAFCKKLEANGVKIDTPYEKHPSGIATATLTDPWGTSIELTEGLNRF